jgi:hypothetical protein
MPIRLSRPRSALVAFIEEFKARNALVRLFEQCKDSVSRPTFDRYVHNPYFLDKKDFSLNQTQKRFIGLKTIMDYILFIETMLKIV